jgi:coenzyme F420-reducing hydrogenase alpha subunit
MTGEHPRQRERRLVVEALARVEGEGALRLVIADGALTAAELRIYEPPRFFEAFLRGRAHTEASDLTSRVCGICPVAYQTSAWNAIEDACGVRVSEPVELLRRLLYCGEWISSHALHIYLLHAPDFFGLPDAIALAHHDRAAIERGLRLKKAGNEILRSIGGRAIHPVNPRVGGFYRAPTHDDLWPLAEQLTAALDDALATAEWVAGFDFPDATIDGDLLALRHPERYALENGLLTSASGLSAPPREFARHIVEHQVAHSTALHATLHGGPYLTGPLARYSLNFDQLSPLARRTALAAGLGPTCRNPFRSIVVRAVEVVYAIEEALWLIDSYRPPRPAALDVPPRAATGHGVSEAPRGLLYHRYELDAEGTIRSATIVPPTSQNQAAIEADVFDVASRNLHLDDAQLTALCERAIRNHDPCISCAAHFLTITVDRR